MNVNNGNRLSKDKNKEIRRGCYEDSQSGRLIPIEVLKDKNKKSSTKNK